MRVVETGEPHDIELSYNADGIIGWFRNMAVKLKHGLAVYFSDISERKQNEQALREAEERLRVALQNAPITVFNQDCQLRYTWIHNPVLHDLDEMIGKRDRDFLPQEEAEILSTIKQQVLNTGIGIRQEVKITANGIDCYYDLTVEPLRDANNAIIGITGAAIDISELKQTTINLRESEARFRGVVESNMVGILFWEESGCITDGNEMAVQMLGYSREELRSGQVRWIDITPPELREIDALMQTEILTTGRCPTFEKAYIRKDGTQVPILIGGALLPGYSDRGVAYFIDITERKQSEAALRESEERFRNMADTAPVMIWMSDTYNLCYYFNKSWLDFTGRTMEQELGNSWLEGVHPHDLGDCVEIYTNSFDARQEFKLEYRLRHCDGEYRWIFDHGIPRFTPNGEFLGYIGSCIDIHDRKQAEEDLRVSEERLQIALQGGDLGTWNYDLTDDNLIWSERCKAIFGIPVETEMSYDVFLAAVHPQDRDRVKQAVALAIAQHQDYDVEMRTLWADGTLRWVRSIGRVYRNQQDLPVRMAGVVLDITDRQQAELEIRKFVSLTDNSTEFIGMCDLNFVPFYINAAGKQMVGIDNTEQYSTTSVKEFFFPDDQDFILNEFFPRVLCEGQAEIEIRFRHFKTGEALWMIYNVFHIKDGDNRPIALATVSRNITERKQAELERERLLARERHYVNQLQGLTSAALAINSALSVEQVLQIITNQAASIIGTHQAVTSMTINQDWAQGISAVHLSDKYAQWRNYEQKPDGTGIYAYLCELNRSVRMTQAELEAHPRWRGFGQEAKNHPPMRGWLAAPLMGRDGQNLGLIQLSDKYEGDFTETDEAILMQLAQMASIAVENAQLYEAEQQARSAAEVSREEAQAANRIKDEFLAVLSHELRSPLNPILGWSRLLQTGKLDQAKTAQALNVIERNAKLQSELIEDLLDVSRILQGKLNLNVVAVDLAAIIQSAMETVRLAAEAKSIQIQHILNPQVGQVAGDTARLQQVVWNLLSNAVKFTPEGGQVEVRLEQYGFQAYITVSDTGKGIPSDFLPYVFDYFRQADSTTTRKFGGLGLGLAIVRHLVELHGGTVQAESPGEDQGARFTVKLPLLVNQTNITEQRQISDASIDLTGVQLLIVDDDTDTRDFVAFLLQESGATVATATSASEALTIFRRSPPDVLISDIGMPNIDGYQLIQQIRALSKEQGGQIPAIALTAYAGDFNQRQALKAGFQQHISKPVKPEILLGAIAALLSN